MTHHFSPIGTVNYDSSKSTMKGNLGIIGSDIWSKLQTQQVYDGEPDG